MKHDDPANIISRFSLDGTVLSCEPHAGGFINRSFLVTDDTGSRYMLQMISQAAFKDPKGLMDNFCKITEFLEERLDDSRACLHVLPAKDGKPWVKDTDGEYWRVLRYVEDSICMQLPETADDFYESGVALGTFLTLLKDFPADNLIETIPNFHHTPRRFWQFKDILSKDPCGKLSEVREEADFLLSLEKEGAILQHMRENGALPVRVTHNDAKIGNVLLDRNTHKALCVIDLDTVMPGLVAYDFGEAIRVGASTGEEDERDLSKVRFEMPLFEAFAKGFIPSCDMLTKKEIETLPLGVFLMTLENGVRMLGDYIAGDVYYTSHYPKQTLYRALVQIKLVKEYQKHRDAMYEIVKRYM